MIDYADKHYLARRDAQRATLKAESDGRPQPHPSVTVALCIALVAVTSWGAQRDEAARAEIAAERAASVTLRECPPPAPGMTDTVVLVVRSTADDKPSVTGCSRIAERSFAARR